MNASAEGIVDEYTYYMDGSGSTYVTNRRVNLGWAEYDLADIRRVSFHEQIIGLRVGTFELPPKVATYITSYPFGIVLVIVLLAFLPADSHDVLRPLGFLAAWVIHGLLNWRLKKRGCRQYVLSMSGTFTLHQAMVSTNEQHLRRIAEAIKRAVRDNMASAQQATQEARMP